MNDDAILQRLYDRRAPETATVEEFLDVSGQDGWNRLRGIARSRPGLVSDELVERLIPRLEDSPASLFALLLDIAAQQEDRREALVQRFHQLTPEHPTEALAAAGYNLHEYHRLLDGRWLALAQRWYERGPAGAWGVFESAALYQRGYLAPEQVDWFEERRAGSPEDYFVSMLSLAAHWPERRAELLARVMRAFPEHPAEAIAGAAAVARDQAPLLVPELLAAVLARFAAAEEKAWEFFKGACGARAELFDDVLLDAIEARARIAPGAMFTILRRLVDALPERRDRLLDRYLTLLRLHPAAGIESAGYDFQGDGVHLLRRDLVEAICDHLDAGAYPAYGLLVRCLKERRDLIGEREVAAAMRGIEHATNYAFGFFSELLGRRPEFTRDCALAVFECLAREPVNRAFFRAEEMDTIVAIAEAAGFRAGLERALREPPRTGSRRARALMAIMFRQKLRARRHVLLEALRHAATLTLWRKIPPDRRGADGEPSEKFSPIWDFALFVIDHAGDDAVSTAAAERFLEGAFQLRYLCRTGADHEEFLRRLDLGYPPAREFPAGLRFLAADAELAALHDLVFALGERFGAPPRIGVFADFAGRREAAGTEAVAVRKALAVADGAKRTKLEERARSLERRIAWWGDPAYGRAMEDPAAEPELPADARVFLARERKDITKQARDALRAEAIRIALGAIESSRMELYRGRIRELLGRELEVERVDAGILPAFLWFQAVEGMPANIRGLKRLIEDRLAGRAHDWLRTEPPALAWAERLRQARPGIRLDRWRAPFSRSFSYRPQDALREKQRRIKADLSRARVLLERAGAVGIAAETCDELAAALARLQAGPEPAPDGAELRPPAPDDALLQEAATDLERVRMAEQTPDSDYEGRIELSVESDPFEILFMGEYGFASCLSLRGINAWSAVSNAIDIDKTIVWAREPGGNVVGRRLLALLPEGLLSFRSYTNRHGLALGPLFTDFIAQYAAHCGTEVIHQGRPGPLLSDRWYDDGAA